MRTMKNLVWAWAALLLGACVTINVYFPAAAAERAADRIIEEVWGPDAQPQPRSAVPAHGVALALLEWLLPAAHAQAADLNISSPASDRNQAQRRARHASLAPLYDAGAVGLTEDGLVAVRDARAVPLAARQEVNTLVADENRDRNALYQEIARANGQPEWEPDIRSTFARRWVERAQPGWFYRAGGDWARK